MKQKSIFSIFVLLCVIALTACTGNDAKKMLIGDLDKYNNTPKQAVEELYNTLPKQGNILRLKEAVKFKENDKLTDYQKDEFFKQLKKKNFNVKATKARTRDEYTVVTATMTFSNGTTTEKKFHVYKEDDVWKTEIGFSELQDAINK